MIKKIIKYNNNANRKLKGVRMYQFFSFGFLLPIIQVVFFSIFTLGIYKKYGEELKQYDFSTIIKFTLLSIFCILVLQPFYQNMVIDAIEIVFILIYHFGVWIKFWARRDNELTQTNQNGRLLLLGKALGLSLLSVIAIQPTAPSTLLMILLIDAVPILFTIGYRRYLGPFFAKKATI